MFDIYAGPGEDWPHLVERELAEAGLANVRVINAGVPGYQTSDTIARLVGELHWLEPDYVVLCAAWNDIKYFRELTPEEPLTEMIRPLTKPSHPKMTPLVRLLDSFQLYRRKNWILTKLGVNAGLEGRLPEGAIADEFGEAGPRQFETNLRIFAATVRAIGAEPILAMQPRLVAPDNTSEERSKITYKYQLLTHEALCAAFDACDAAYERVSADEGVALIDPRAEVSGVDAYFVDHVHTTEEGSRALAREFAAQLRGIVAPETE